MRTRLDRAFTLIELLVVISIIALLSSVVLASLNAARDKARIAAGRQFGQNVASAAGEAAIGIYDFDECSGTLARDRSGFGYDGTLTNSPAWSADTPFGTGCSILLNGTNWVALANSAAMDAGTAFTAAAWVKLAATPAGWFDVLAGGSNDFGIGLVPGLGAAVVRLTKVNIQDAVPSVTPVAIGQWHHIAAVFSSNAVTYYVDGRSAGSSVLSQTFASGAKRIGSRTSVSGNFNGNIDGVRLYAKTLTADEVGAVYAQGVESLKFAGEL